MKPCIIITSRIPIEFSNYDKAVEAFSKLEDIIHNAGKKDVSLELFNEEGIKMIAAGFSNEG